MKAMVLRGPRELAFDEVARPKLSAGQVLVRVTHSGVCGTDLKIYNGAIPVRYPLIMGHEATGEVVDAGGNEGVRAGDRVIMDPELFCGVCFQCRVGQTHLCPNGQLLGRDANGGFAEYVAVPASHVFPLPDSIDGRVAPLIQVLTTCMHAQRLVQYFPWRVGSRDGSGRHGPITRATRQGPRRASGDWNHAQRIQARTGGVTGRRSHHRRRPRRHRKSSRKPRTGAAPT